MKRGMILFIAIFSILLITSFISAASVCSDSDNGKNFAVKGAVNYNNQTFSDYCYVYGNTTYNYLVEYYCTNTSYSTYRYT